jgi:leucyl/phenylalanyl-tRNA--protein transferase
VVRNCFRPRDNWLTEEFVVAYTEAHLEGWGHSCEVWKDGDLAGGIYGLAVGQSFSAESMFHRVTDASKVALWAMVEKCRSLGFKVFDAQIMNPHLASMGAFEVPEREFLGLLDQLRDQPTPWSQRRG